MVPHALLVEAAGTGLVGVSAYEALPKAVGTAPVHRAAVTVTERVLRGARRAEVPAESARLKVADVVGDARDRIGEQACLPVADQREDDDCC